MTLSLSTLPNSDRSILIQQAPDTIIPKLAVDPPHGRAVAAPDDDIFVLLLLLLLLPLPLVVMMTTNAPIIIIIRKKLIHQTPIAIPTTTTTPSEPRGWHTVVACNISHEIIINQIASGINGLYIGPVKVGREAHQRIILDRSTDRRGWVGSGRIRPVELGTGTKAHSRGSSNHDGCSGTRVSITAAGKDGRGEWL